MESVAWKIVLSIICYWKILIVFLPKKKNTILIVTQFKVKSKIFATAYTSEQDVYGFSLRPLHTVINMPLIFTCCCSKYKNTCLTSRRQMIFHTLGIKCASS